MNYIYLISLVFAFPLVFSQVKKLYYIVLNRLFLQNRKVQEKVQPLVEMALKEYDFVGYHPSEYTEIKVVRLNKDTDMIVVELFIHNKNDLTKWNPVERLVKIKGLKVADKFIVKSLEDSNSRDLGAIIPNNSNVPLNRLFRSRRWKRQQKYWKEYQPDWNIKWMDQPIW